VARARRWRGRLRDRAGEQEGQARAAQEGHGGQAAAAAVFAVLAIVAAFVVCVVG
jgi:hypothetical protein